MQQQRLLPEPFVVCADNMDIIRQWPDKCIDLVVADPPYFQDQKREAIMDLINQPQKGRIIQFPKSGKFRAMIFLTK